MLRNKLFKITVLLIGIALGFALFTTCKEDTPAPEPTPSNVSVYISGFYSNGSNDKACYWKDGVKTDLSGDTFSYALGIVVSGGSVYIVGEYYDSSHYKACYWKDGTR